LVLNVTPDWLVAKRADAGDYEYLVYLKKGDNPFYYSEILKQEVRPKASARSVKSVESAHRKVFRRIGCRVSTVSVSADGKRSTLRYECAKAKRSGAMLTVEGENATIYSVLYEVPKAKAEANEMARLLRFLQDNAKICQRSDRTQCIR
jgi:hypothetical protein